MGKASKAITGIKRLMGTFPLRGELPLTEAEYRRGYLPTGASFTDYLPWVDYDPEHGVFLLDDNINIGAVYEIPPFDVDGMPQDVLDVYQSTLDKALQAVPMQADHPWILQIYLQDEPLNADTVADWLRQYAHPDCRDSKLTRTWIKIYSNFIESSGDGLFREPGHQKNWAPLSRTVRLCVYRRLPRDHYYRKDGKLRPGVVNPAQELDQAMEGFEYALRGGGLAMKRLNGEDFYRWMFPWLSPNPTGYDSVMSYMQDHPYAGEDPDRPYAFDLGTLMTSSAPQLLSNELDDRNGIYDFNGQLQRFISLEGIHKVPTTGLLTADQTQANQIVPALFDRLPEKSIFVTTITVRDQDEIQDSAQNIISKIGTATYEQDLTYKQADNAMKNRVYGDRLYSIFCGVYLRADNEQRMQQVTQSAISALSNDFKPISPKNDPIADRMYLHQLPMAYSYEFDAQKSVRARLAYTRHIASLLPLYGRGRGTGHPGYLWFNRVGELFAIDPYNKRDRTKTAHGILLGPTGSGKSATMVNNALHNMAMRRPRQFFIEKGKSFSLLEKYYKANGLSTYAVVCSPKSNISLPPYAAATQALQQYRDMEELPDPEDLLDMEDLNDDDLDDDDQRDYLGEMELATQIMITRASEREYDKMTPQDQFVIQKAIVDALEQAEREQLPHPLITHVTDALTTRAQQEDTETRKIRVMEMAESLRLWTQGMRGQFFNRYGQDWPEVDALFFDLGIMTAEQNKDMLALTIISLLNHITGLGEKYQYDSRETDVYGDEWHLVLKHLMLIKPLVFAVKTWRKLGLWLIQGTQNMDDFPKEAKVMLNLAEWWYCLVMPKGEIADIEKFRELTPEQKQLMISARKEPGKYVEGVVMSDTVTSLFRVVMPGLALALAQTDNDEKVIRRRIMEQHDICELDAALKIGEEIDKARCLSRS